MEANLICAECKHFKHQKFNCIAFPDGIPEIIFSGENDHSKPLPNQDNDIIFEPIK
jgi:hypothetical protein